MVLKWKRVTRRHKYWTAVFKDGKFFKFYKWRRSDPETWIIRPQKHKLTRLPEPEKEDYQEPKKEDFGAWYRASASAKTKDVLGRITDIDGTATHYGSKEETIQLLKDGFKKSCGYPADYWGFDEDIGKWFLDFGALQIYVEIEKVKVSEVKLGKMQEEVFIVSCR